MVDLRSEFSIALKASENEKLRDPWGLHAQHLADGIERSGLPSLLGDVRDAVRSQALASEAQTHEIKQGMASMEGSTLLVRDAVMALAATNAAGFAAICEELGETNDLLGDIEQLLANPLSTSAAERYRRGLHALSQGWPDLAMKELDASIEQDPFQAIAHFARGLALGSQHRESESVDALESAIRFCGKDSNLDPLAAGAAILAGQALVKQDEIQRAMGIVAAVHERVGDTYPELLLMKGHLGDDREALQTAISTAPELSAVAVLTNVNQARETSQSVHDDPTGPIQAMRTIAQKASTLGCKVPIPTSAPKAMSFHRTWVDSFAQGVTEEAINVLAEADRAAIKATRDKDRVAGIHGTQTLVPKTVLRNLGAKETLRGAGSAVLLIVGAIWILRYIVPAGVGEHPGLGVMGILAIVLAGAGFLEFSSALSAARSKSATERTHARSATRATAIAKNEAQASEASAKTATEKAVIAKQILGLMPSSIPERRRPLITPQANSVA